MNCAPTSTACSQQIYEEALTPTTLPLSLRLCYNCLDFKSKYKHTLARNFYTMQYAILGGGALGLGAAYRLTKAGHSVMLFEQETTAGGLAAGFRVGDAWLEKFYHHLFRTDTTIIKLIEELGLGDRLEWLRPRPVSLIGGEIPKLDSPLTLLNFSPWRIDERLRVAAVSALLKFSGSK